MLSYFKKAGNFVKYPTHSRTMGILIMLVLVSAISLTVIASQQQQTLKQRAEADCDQQYNDAVTACNSSLKQEMSNCPQTGEEEPANECQKSASKTMSLCLTAANENKSACEANQGKPVAPTPTPTIASGPLPLPTPLKEDFVEQQSLYLAALLYADSLSSLDKEYGNIPADYPKKYYPEMTQENADLSRSQLKKLYDQRYTDLKLSALSAGSAPTPPNTNTATFCPNLATSFCSSTLSLTKPVITLSSTNLSFTIAWQSTSGSIYTIWRKNAQTQTAIPIKTITASSTRTSYMDSGSEAVSPVPPESLRAQVTYYYYIVSDNMSCVSSNSCLDQFAAGKTDVGAAYHSGFSTGGVGSASNGVPSSTGSFQCRNYLDSQGTAVNLKCVDVINSNQWCGNGWTVLKPASTDTKQSGCGAQSLTSEGQVCCKQNAAVAAVPTAIPTATPTPINNVILALALNTQDIPTLSPTPTASITPTDSITPTVTIAPAFSDNLSVKVSIFSRTTNELIAGNPATQVSFAKTPIPKKQYAANMSLKDLPKDSYYVVLEKNGLLAITAFTVSTVNQTITVPTTTLVYGDITKDKRITALDWNALRDCWGKSTKNNPSCQAADFDQSGEVNPIDFNILMRGWATWNEEEKIVNL